MSFCHCKKHIPQSLSKSGAFAHFFLMAFSLNLLFVTESVTAQTSVGSVTIVIGSSYITKEGQKKVLRKGDRIGAGDTIATRSNGHVHIKFDDQGIVSVRPNSKLIIEQYSYNAEQPNLSTVKFNLIKGVARSISGRAAKAARSRFRMNTPIAAIGVRGTDFIVSANNKAIKAFVNEGIIVVSPFSDVCSASTLGPCRAAAVELHGNKNQLLELHNQQALATVRSIKADALPRVLYESQPDEENINPNIKAPESTDEQLKSDDAETDTNEELSQQVIDPDNSIPTKTLDNTTTHTVVEESLVLETDQITIDQVATQTKSTLDINDDTDLLKPELTSDLSTVDSFSYVIPNSPIASSDLTKRQLVWGRWNIDSTQQLISTDYQDAAAGRTISVSNDTYGLFRQNDGTQALASNLGKVSFNLHFADVDYFTLSGSSTMSVKDGFLDMDFNSRSFTTGLNLNSSQTGDIGFSAKGSISDKGFFNQPNGSSTLGGAVSFDGKEAAYFFEQELENGTIKGTTLWGIP